jgi:UPF0755 protein
VKRLGLILLVLALLSALAAFAVRERWQAPLALPPEGMTLVVEKGDSLRSVARQLHAREVLVHPRLLTVYGRATGLDQQIKRGEYQVPPGTTAPGLLALLIAGDVISYAVTLPEGITLGQAIELLQREKALDAVLSGPDDERLLALVAPHTSTEGLFLPETYRYERGDSDYDILLRAHRALNSVLTREWAARAPELPLESPYEALILASIIERETGQPQERGEIAGVFTRRLQRGMLLQTDPTVIYGLGEEYDGNLRRVHLRDEANPYNTYRHRGLPPTPIALPGEAAIAAATHPAPGKSLYFVARGDGGHYFSETLAEHNKAVRKYQLNRASNYRSAPK